MLDAESRALARLEQGGGAGAAVADPVLLALADASRRFPLPDGALAELIEGVRMDVVGASYESFDELVLYCRRVAGAIGRVCLAIFGVRDRVAAEQAGAERLADELGVAMQLTNILRDVREDAENGRVYLPAEDLRRFGLLAEGRPASAAELLAALERPEVADLLRFEASGHRRGSGAGSRSPACSTGAARPGCWRWLASTAACSSASRRSRRCPCGAACRCPPARRRGWPSAACSGWGRETPCVNPWWRGLC